MRETIKIAVIACGNRARGVVNSLLKASNRKVDIVSVYDPDPAEMDFACDSWMASDARHCASSLEAINTPGVEWVMIFSPNAFHKQHILEAFAAGKDVFTEKPLATSIEDCQEIFDAHQKSGVKFATGFVLRFAPIYRKVKEMLESGEFGDLITIDACENIEPYHGSYIMKNWRRKTSEAGPHILEKCCHDIDLLNWFVGSLASKVAAFGGRDFFLPKNAELNEKYPNHFKETWRDPHAIDTPFTEDTDLMDNTVAIFEYRNGVRVQFQATMANAIAERRMVFRCSLGTIMIELYSSTLTWQTLGSNKQSIIFGGDNHGGGDAYIMKELYEGPMCQEDVLPKCSGNEGLESAVLALAIDKAAQTRQIVDLEPVWQKLNR